MRFESKKILLRFLMFPGLLLLTFDLHAQDEESRNVQQEESIQDYFLKEQRARISELLTKQEEAGITERAAFAIEAGNRSLELARRLKERSEDNSFENDAETALAQFQQARELSRAEHNHARELLATNNIGTVRLLMDDPQVALEEFESIDAAQLNKEEAFVVHYNRGRCLEQLDGRTEEAIEQFRIAFECNPQFTRILPRVIDLAWDDENCVDGLFEFASIAVNNGQAATLLEILNTCRADTAEQLEFLTYAFALSYSELRILPVEFVEKYAENFETSTGNEACTAELKKAYSEVLHVETGIEHTFSVEQFPWWSNQNRDPRVRSAFARLLRNIGDYYTASGLYASDSLQTEEFATRHNQAIACYMIAWTVDPEYFESAESVAWAVERQGEKAEINQDIYDAIIEKNSQLWVERTFDGKSGLIREVYLNASQENKVRLMQTHILLGTHFENVGEYGDIYSPRSAVFQFTQAARVSNEIGYLHDGDPTPDIYYRLANAFNQAGNEVETTRYLSLCEAIYNRQAAEAGLERDTDVFRQSLFAPDDPVPNSQPYEEFELAGATGEYFNIQLHSDDFDTYLMLYSPDGELIRENDDVNGDSSHSQILQIIDESGTYKVRVSAYGSEPATGDFALEITRGPNAMGTAPDYDR